MSVLANRRSKAKPRQRFFQIHFVIEQDSYVLSVLPAHPDVAAKAFRFRKTTGDQAVYDVRLTDAFGLECECKGFLAHRHCKHCDTLRAAEGVFRLS